VDRLKLDDAWSDFRRWWRAAFTDSEKCAIKKTDLRSAMTDMCGDQLKSSNNRFFCGVRFVRIEEGSDDDEA
jgi:hypothetical protein